MPGKVLTTLRAKSKILMVMQSNKELLNGASIESRIKESLEKNVGNVAGLFEWETADQAIKDAMNTPDPIYLFDYLVQEKELILFFGDTGTGKTIFALGIAIKIASSGKRVLFLDLELSKKQFQKRCANENGEPCKMPETLFRVGYSRLRSVPKDISYTEFFFDSLRQIIQKVKPDVIVLDNMTKLAAGDTDTAKAAIPIIEGLNLLKDEGLTIVAIEHNKKVDPSRPIQLNDLQGSKMKANLVDSIFTIGRSYKDKNLRYIKQVKVRDGEHHYDTENVMMVELSREKGYLGFSHRGFCDEHQHLKAQSKTERETKIEEVKELTRQGKTQRAISEQLGISVGAVNKYLKA